jgi:hypothetical protein
MRGRPLIIPNQSEKNPMLSDRQSRAELAHLVG